MKGRFELKFRPNCKKMAAAGKAALMLGMLAGCSSVPDAINPVEWYKGASDLITGTERPQTAQAKPPKGEFPDVNKTPPTKTKDAPAGLSADRGGAKYAEPVRREVTPTKPLAKKSAPAATETQVAQAQTQAVVPPKPAVTKAELPEARVPYPAPAQRDQGPAAPPASVDMTPPPRPDIPETVALGGARGKLREAYQQRLAEFDRGYTGPAAAPALASRDDAPIHLVPPGGRQAKKSGGGKGFAAPPPEPAASFQVASVDFSAGSAQLTRADLLSIAEVAKLYKQTKGGVVRVVGHAPAPQFGNHDAVAQVMGGLDASLTRANAVARELTKRGVPASKIQIAADPQLAASNGGGAQVYLDVM